MTSGGFELSIHDRKVASQLMNNWKLTPATFAHKISRGSWIPAEHLMYISLKVAQAVARGNGRIIISAPPRHGKSQLTSIYVPSWLLECFPMFKVILAGYGAELATGFSRQVRDIFTDKDNENLLKTRIRQDASRVEAFLTEQGGGMYAVGLGGAITGRGANVLLIDDYIKEIKEALSPTYRQYIWDWFVTTAYTRLEPNGTCIIIATRWHSDDLIGRLLATQRDQWEYIELPALAEEGDILGREIGEALFPERYPIERLEELRETLGSTFFKALFQQKPVDETAKLTDSAWLKIIDSIPDEELRLLRRARIWDFAATEGGGDYTAGSLCAYNKHNSHFYLENVKRGQYSPEQIETLIRTTAIADGEDVKIYLEQEPGASGLALIEHYQRNVLPEFIVEAIPAVKNKLVRAQPYLAAAEGGKVYLLAGVWNDPYKKEFDSFPGGDYDDQVDTSAAGYQKLSGKKVFSASWGRKPSASLQPSGPSTSDIRRAQISLSRKSGNGPVKRISGATFGRR